MKTRPHNNIISLLALLSKMEYDRHMFVYKTRQEVNWAGVLVRVDYTAVIAFPIQNVPKVYRLGDVRLTLN